MIQQLKVALDSHFTEPCAVAGRSRRRGRDLAPTGEPQTEGGDTAAKALGGSPAAAAAPAADLPAAGAGPGRLVLLHSDRGPARGARGRGRQVRSLSRPAPPRKTMRRSSTPFTVLYIYYYYIRLLLVLTTCKMNTFLCIGGGRDGRGRRSPTRGDRRPPLIRFESVVFFF